MDKTFKLAEIAANHKCSQKTVRKWIRDNHLGCIKVGKHIRVTQTQLVEFERRFSGSSAKDITPQEIAKRILSGVA